MAWRRCLSRLMTVTLPRDGVNGHHPWRPFTRVIAAGMDASLPLHVGPAWFGRLQVSRRQV